MALGAALGTASVLGNILGTIMSARQNNKVSDIMEGRMNDLQSRFEKDYNTNFLETDQAKSVLQILSQQFADQNKKIDNASAVTGASPEAKIASRGESQEKFGEAITRLAGYGTQYKDMKEREFNRRNDNLQNIFLQHEMGKAQNWLNFMNNATNLGQTASMGNAMNENSGSLLDLLGDKGLGKGIV